MYCRQCSNDSGIPIVEELSFEEVMSLCSQLVAMGLRDFRFYGGEPFLRKDIAPIAQFLSNQSIQIAFYTNGTILNQDILGLLKAVIRPRIFVSLDGASSQTHDDIRGLKGSFDIVVRNISSLVSLGYRVDIIMTISRKNYTEVDEVFRLGKSLGVSSIKPDLISRIGRAKIFWDEFSLSPRQMSEIAKMIFKANTHYFQKKGIRKPCVAGVDEIYISSNGNVFPCALLLDYEFCAGNIRNNSLADILQNPSLGFSQIVSSIRNQEFCGECDNKDRCQGGCRARAILEHNEISRKDIFSCLYQAVSCRDGDKEA